MKIIQRIWLPLAAAALTAVAFAAVSVAQDDKPEQGAPAGDVVFAGPPEEFIECMKDQGVDLPGPPRLDREGNDGEPRTFEHRIDPPSEEERAKMDEAFEACKDKLPEGARQFGPHPCGPPPGAPKGEGAAIPAPPPSSGSQRS